MVLFSEVRKVHAKRVVVNLTYILPIFTLVQSSIILHSNIIFGRLIQIYKDVCVGRLYKLLCAVEIN